MINHMTVAEMLRLIQLGREQLKATFSGQQQRVA
jgi:hypothetical protein